MRGNTVRADEVGVVDLFCGVGGLTHGLKQAGLKGVVGIDADESCRYAYETNNAARFKSEDVSTLSIGDVRSLFDDNAEYTVLVGCAPCQPFSSLNRSGAGTQWRLVEDFARIAVGVRPDVVSMENVPALRHHPVFQDLVSQLRAAGYSVWCDVVDCSRYGTPQKRKRLVVLASLREGIRLTEPTHDSATTVRDAIGKLGPIAAGETSESDPLHRSAALSNLNLRRLRATPEGGSWKDWPEEIRLACHRKASGRSYPSIYGRLSWNEPAPTLTTQFHTLGTGRWGHPEQDRALSLREGALLQGFPADYAFTDPSSAVGIGETAKHIGNAVPVPLGRAIGVSLLSHLGDRGQASAACDPAVDLPRADS